jgi:hypothetical protein
MNDRISARPVDTAAGQLSMPVPKERALTLPSLTETAYLLSAPESIDLKYGVRRSQSLGRIVEQGIGNVTVLTDNVTPEELRRLKIDLKCDDPGFFVGAPGRHHHENAIYKHLRALEIFLETGAATALICEDDVLFHDRFQELFPTFMANVPANWDVVYVGFANPIRELLDGFSKVNSRIWSGPFWCLHCLLVTRDGAQKILGALPIHDQIDFFYGRLARDGVINCYAFNMLEQSLEDCRRVSYTPRGLAYQERDEARGIR